MKEKVMELKDTTKSFWVERSSKQKGIFIGSLALLLILIVIISLLMTNSKYVPLYTNLSIQEVGQIKTELDARGVPYELEQGGTTIKVPENHVDHLLVELAGQGLPDSGNIDYSFFSENTSWGITDNEFNMIRLDAMQTELANLIKSIEGIDDAEVMINMPKEPVFVNEEMQPTSASIILKTRPNYQFKENQIDSLYHLVSKAVPNLSTDNIVIRNQFLEYFDQQSAGSHAAEDTFTYQQNVKQDIETDIQRRVQQMLGTMVGMENVIVSVTADVDFTSENRIEELVEPVDPENFEGLPVSIETIRETYTGNAGGAGGVVGTGEGEIPGYEGVDIGEDGEYELVKETVNNEFNRIYREIAESPYKLRDLGIQVAVNNVVNRNDQEVEYLNQQDMTVVEQGISSILHSIISTSVDKEYGEIEPEENISIVFQEFSETTAIPEPSSTEIPTRVYIALGVLLLLILLLVIILIRNRQTKREEITETELTANTVTEVPDIQPEEESESVIRKKQLEKMAKEKPEDFAKLLRSWISED